MSKGLRNYTGAELRAVVSRRLAQNSRGAGYWAARAAADKLGISVPAPKAHKPRRAPRRNRDDDTGDQAPGRRRIETYRDTPVYFNEFLKNYHAYPNESRAPHIMIPLKNDTIDGLKREIDQVMGAK